MTLLATTSNDTYKPLSILDESEKDKTKSFYLFVKVNISSSLLIKVKD
jgi:hypothetical protein